MGVLDFDNERCGRPEEPQPGAPDFLIGVAVLIAVMFVGLVAGLVWWLS